MKKSTFCKIKKFIYYSLLLNNYSLLLKMIPKNTKKITLFLLKNIDEFGYNINQISKLNKISVGSAFKILKQFEKDNLVVKKDISNASHYKLNFDNPEMIKLCELLILGEKRILKGYSKIYAEEIIKFEQAEIIIIFGSVLKEKVFNDVDVLFVTTQTKKVNEFCLDISKIRTKPVVPLILRKEDIIKEIKNKREPIIDLIKKGVVLKGENEFMEMMKNVNS